MLKILSAQQIREADAFTIKQEPIKSINLMERAAKACADWIISMAGTSKPLFVVVCGSGNNGGDGLAIARLLHAQKHKVQVLLVDSKAKYSTDAELNLKHLKKIKAIKLKNAADFDFGVVNDVVIVDAIFGTGLNKPVDGIGAEIIGKINNSQLPVISIDIPSGCPAEPVDEVNYAKQVITKATHTLTFESPKLSFLLAETGNYCGNFHVLDIGLNKDFISHQSTNQFYIEHADIALLTHDRPKFSHKGNYGHALLVAGCKGKMGAATLAANACLRSGVGLVSLLIPHVGYTIAQTAVPEAMVISDPENDFITEIKTNERITAVGVGPGIGTEQQTQNALKLFIQNFKGSFVLDADALNILADNKTWLAFLPKNTILTPHPTEFDRLVGNSSKVSSHERLNQQRDLAIKHSLIVVLKGAHTTIATPAGHVYFNSTGNSGMAKGGSGDVLTGILTSLLAQGYSPINAALMGVYLHGLAGDIAADVMGVDSMIASDIIESLPEAFEYLKTQ